MDTRFGRILRRAYRYIIRPPVRFHNLTESQKCEVRDDIKRMVWSNKSLRNDYSIRVCKDDIPTFRWEETDTTFTPTLQECLTLLTKYFQVPWFCDIRQRSFTVYFMQLPNGYAFERRFSIDWEEE